MIKQVFENRHPDGGIPELVTYCDCDDCGKDITHDHCYFVGDAKDGRECYCEECAVSSGWVKCDKCGEIIEERNVEDYFEEIKNNPDNINVVYMFKVCHSCLEKLEEDV